jgi:DNA-binding CsgD family transcriptional regulator
MDDSSMKKIVKLQSETDFRIYMLPLRQKILRLLRIQGKAMTSKQIADKLGISPSSARHHLLRLMELGLVEHDHYESVNGIQANYLRSADVTVSIGGGKTDGLYQEREELISALVYDTLANFQKTMRAGISASEQDETPFIGDLFSGIAHLSQKDATEFYSMARDFLETHALPNEESDNPWELACIFYNTCVHSQEEPS